MHFLTSRVKRASLGRLWFLELGLCPVPTLKKAASLIAGPQRHGNGLLQRSRESHWTFSLVSNKINEMQIEYNESFLFANKT